MCGVQRSELYGEPACVHTRVEKAFSESNLRPKWIGRTNCLNIEKLRRATYLLRANGTEPNGLGGPEQNNIKKHNICSLASEVGDSQR